jgi:hypothetical protein
MLSGTIRVVSVIVLHEVPSDCKYMREIIMKDARPPVFN